MNKKISKSPGRMNRTMDISSAELQKYFPSLIHISKPVIPKEILNKTIHQDLFNVVEFLPDKFIDLLFVDPPYNMRKEFNQTVFQEKSIEEYSKWIDSFVQPLQRCLKPNASIYFCGDWKSSTSIHNILSKYFTIRNRITWEREKGRGSKNNWKNNSEDIWFATVGNKYLFHHERVQLKRRVIAPYRLSDGAPKGWEESAKGPFRLTYPSNIWTDISVPFWSMTENTVHPTQKPEKLLAKIILASSNEGDVVFDPFLGSGTTSVVAKKLNRNYVGVELDKKFACIVEKRLEIAKRDSQIQGYADGVFWERNSIKNVKRSNK